MGSLKFGALGLTETTFRPHHHRLVVFLRQEMARNDMTLTIIHAHAGDLLIKHLLFCKFPESGFGLL
jgi:hypothetical protein